MAMAEFTCGIPNELWNGMEREERQEGRRRWNALSKDDHRAIWDGKRPPLAEMVGEAEWDWTDPAAAEAEKTIQDQVRAGRMKLRTLTDGRRRLELGPELAFRERINRELLAAMRAKNLPASAPCAASDVLPAPSDPARFEEVLRQRWRTSPDLRAEFGERIEDYIAYMRHEGAKKEAAARPTAKKSVVGNDASSVDARARAEWDADAEIRAEFSLGGFESYRALRRAEARHAR